ncbi:unnamed protein product [Trichobilharzia regenti]|nr:unnamed protein product [Trichobilharzia regenti]
MFEWSTPVPVVAGFTNTFSLTAAGASGQFPAGSRVIFPLPLFVFTLVFTSPFFFFTNKFGCGDAEGNFGLWNLYSTMPGKLPYFVSFNAFVLIVFMLGNGGISTASFTSSGLVESTGSSGGGGGTGGIAQFTSSSSGSGSSSYSSGGGGGNISLDQDASHLTLWDTLLPVNRCGVIRVLDPELDAPCTSIAYCGAFSQVNRWPHSTSSSGLYNNTAETSTSSSSTKRLYTSDRTVIVGNKNGDVCIVDLRRPKVLHKFSAHESAVRTLCIDTMTDCLMTGGADGIVKVRFIGCCFFFILKYRCLFVEFYCCCFFVIFSEPANLQ